MTLNEFIEQLKKTKPGNRIEFFKQHLQDEFWLDVVRSKSAALQIFRFCCVRANAKECVEVFDILVRKGCFVRIIQKFDETHIVNNNILSILKICPELLGNWFSGPLKFETVDTFFTFLVYGSKYSGDLNLAGNIEQFLKYDTIKYNNFYSLQSALTQSRKYNKQTYNYILKLISEANADIIKSFNSNHKVEEGISKLILNVPEICGVLLKPPFIFDNVTYFVNTMWSILVMYEKKPSDTYILKYFDDCAGMIQFASDDIESYILEVHMAYYLSEFLNRNLNHMYGLLINMVCKNKKYVDELYAGTQYIMKQMSQQYVIKGCKKIIKDLESVVYNQMTDDTVTADDIKELFDI